MTDVTVVTTGDPAPDPADDATAFAAGAAAATAAVAAQDAAQAQATADEAQATATAAALVTAEGLGELSAQVAILAENQANQGALVNALALNALAQAEELDTVEDELVPEKVDKPTEPEHHEPRHGMSSTWFPKG
jgi:hypothetical protein